MLQQKGKRLNDAIEGFSVGDTTVSFITPAEDDVVNASITELEPMSLAVHSYKYVSFTPLS
eukprot:12790828-Prorocentrum_lima.AAC.1